MGTEAHLRLGHLRIAGGARHRHPDRHRNHRLYLLAAARSLFELERIRARCRVRHAARNQYLQPRPALRPRTTPQTAPDAEPNRRVLVCGRVGTHGSELPHQDLRQLFAPVGTDVVRLLHDRAARCAMAPPCADRSMGRRGQTAAQDRDRRNGHTRTASCSAFRRQLEGWRARGRPILGRRDTAPAVEDARRNSAAGSIS